MARLLCGGESNVADVLEAEKPRISEAELTYLVLTRHRRETSATARRPANDRHCEASQSRVGSVSFRQTMWQYAYSHILLLGIASY
jgi:hypothetical protein